MPDYGIDVLEENSMVFPGEDILDGVSQGDDRHLLNAKIIFTSNNWAPISIRNTTDSEFEDND